MKITTKSGFEAEITDDFLNDFEFLSLARDLDNAEQSGDEAEMSVLMMDICKKLLGKAQYSKMLNHLKSKAENGKITFQDGYNELGEIFKAFIEAKKK